MRSNYDIYEFREVTNKDACADYSSMGMLAPVLTMFSPIFGVKCGAVWGYVDRIHGFTKTDKYLRLVYRSKNKCLPLTDEYYKRMRDVMPMETWK